MNTIKAFAHPSDSSDIRIHLLILIIIALSATTLKAEQDSVDTTTGMVAGWEEGRFFLKSEDENYLLNIGGRIQPRYQYQSQTAGEDLSSFYLRRVRLDLRGHLFNKDLTFRVMPEMSRTATLRDGWISYSFTRMLNLQGGQFPVPFQRQRFISGNRHFFAERSAPSEQFGFPTGYDVGIALHGRNETNTFSYGAGVFDGAGRNVQYSNSNGNMASARVTRAIIGALPSDETAYDAPETLQLTFGAGIQGATKNEVRNWDLDRSAAGNTRANWVTGTGDLTLKWNNLSIAADGYLRQVNPEATDVDPYTGWAAMMSAGYFIIPQKLEIIGRISELNYDTEDSDTQVRIWDAGFNIYHRAHRLKTQVNYSFVDQALGDEHVFLMQLHLLF